MSSNCPPQLHLELPANTTSFKRSFEQFGFDLESPGGGTEGAGASGSDGNDRNKRARSASRFSDDSDSSGSSTVASGSSMSLSGSESETDVQAVLSPTGAPDGHGAPHYSLALTRSSQEPPRLPTPELQDIEMVDYSPTNEIQSGPHSATAIGGSSNSQADESYRLSLERFNAFDTQISALRRSHSPTMTRSPTSPPVLPPLELLGDESRLNTSTIPFMHPPTQSSSPPLPESLYSFGLPLLNRSQRPGPSSISREDPRILPHETHSQAEGSTSLGAQRQTAPRFSSAPHPTSHQSSPTSREEAQTATLPYIQFSPNSLWTRYDDSPSPTSDDQEFEFTEFRGSDFAPALELRSSSPLFNELEDDDEFRPMGRPVEPNPPTLPPIHNVWDDPLEDLIEYSSTAPRAGSSGARGESVASSSRSGTQTQPALDRISTRNLAPLRDTAIPSAASSDGDHHDHSLPSPFLPNLGGWMEGENNTTFGLPSDWLPSPTRGVVSNTSPNRDTAGPNRSSVMGDGADWSWATSRANTSANTSNTSNNGVHPRLLSRDSSASGSYSDGARAAFRAMLTSEHRAQASSSAVSTEQQEVDAIPRRLRFSGTQLGTPLEAQMGPWLSERSRDSPAPEPETLNDGLTPAERISSQLDAIAAASRRTLRELESRGAPSPQAGRDDRLGRPERISSQLDALAAATRRTAREYRGYSGGSAYEGQFDESDAMDADARMRQNRIPRDVSPPPRISTDTDSLAGPLFPSGPSHFYESINQTWNEPSGNSSLHSNPAPSASRNDSYIGRSNLAETSQVVSEQSSSRPAWSWVDNTTVEVQHASPSPPGPVSSAVPASDLLRMRARLYSASVRMNQATAPTTASPPRRPSRYELISRLAQSRPPPTTATERRVGPLFSPDHPPMNYSTLRPRVSPPAAPSLMFVRPQIYTHQSTRVRDYPTRQRNPPSWSAGSARSSMEESSGSLLDHAMEMESDAARSSGTNFPRRLGARFPVPSAPESERPQVGARVDFPAVQREQPVFQPEWLNLSDEEIAQPSNHRHTHSLTDMRRDINDMSGAIEAQRRQQSRDVSPRRPESLNMADFVYLDVPSLPSPGLGEIFQHSEPVNATADRGQRSGPFGDTRSAPRSLVNNPPDRGYRPTSSITSHPDIRGPQYPPSFSVRRRSPSPTREEQGSRRPPLPRAGPSATGPSTNRGPMTIDPNSFAPGPFRNTLERFVNINRARENRAAPPPSIPPLAFQSNASMRIDPSPQASHPVFWPTASNNTIQTSLPYPEDTPSSDPDEDWGWHQPTYPRSPPENPPPPPQRPSGWRYPRADDTPPPRAPVDVHNYLTQRARIEASRIENPNPPQIPQQAQGDTGGFSHAIEVLRQDGLSSTRSHQLITRFHLNRNRAQAEPRNLASSERLSSPWGIIDHAGPSSSDPRDAGGATNAETSTWGSRSAREIAADVLAERHRNPPPVPGDSDRERVVQVRRRIRFARQHEIGSMFAPSGMMQDYVGRFGRRARAMGDYMRDEDFDESYESLLSLAATLGEAKPRATPDEVIAGMDTGLYKDWKTADSDHRCPICLDDYQPDDPLLKLNDCSHWLHRECLQQWLKGASTCPVCRKAVGNTCRTHRRNHNSSNEPGPSWRRDPPGSGPGGSGGSGAFGAGRGAADDGNDWPPPWRYTPAP